MNLTIDLSNNKVYIYIKFLLLKNKYKSNTIPIENRNGYECTYDKYGNRVSYKNYNTGYSTKSTYNERGQILTKIDSDGDGYENIYDEMGNIVAHKDTNGFFYMQTYDIHGNKLNYMDTNGYSYQYTYDEHGNNIKLEDSKGFTAESTYDEYDNVLTIKDSNGLEKYFSYDIKRKTVTYSDSKGNYYVESMRPYTIKKIKKIKQNNRKYSFRKLLKKLTILHITLIIR